MNFLERRSLPMPALAVALPAYAWVVAAVGAVVMVFLLRESLRTQFVTTTAARYLIKRPMSWVAMAIITLIVVLYLLIMAVVEGFKAHYMEQVQSIHAHITVRMRNDPGGIIYPEPWAQKLEALEGVRGVSVGLETPALVIFDKGHTLGTLRGIDLENELRHGRIQEFLTPPDLAAFGIHDVRGAIIQGCVVGGAWKNAFDLKLGDDLTTVTTDSTDIQNIKTDMKAYKIVGFFEGKNDLLEGMAFVDRRTLAQRLGLPGQAKTLFLWVEGNPDRPDLDLIKSQVRIKMNQILDAEAARPTDYREEFTAYKQALTVETWREKQANWYYAVSRENMILRFIMFIFLFFVVMIVMLILSRLVAEKVRDIGVLRALGATPHGIRACFLAQGLFIALVGLAVGVPLGLLLVTYVNEVAALLGVEVFPQNQFLIDRIPVHVLPFDVALIVGLTLLAGFLGALLPAWRASRMDPVECLRHE